jgi:protein-tyrosine-phosphatase
MKGFIFPGFPVLSALIYVIIRDDLTDYEKKLVTRGLRKGVEEGNRDDMIALIYLEPAALRMPKINEEHMRSADIVADMTRGNLGRYTEEERKRAEDFFHAYFRAIAHLRWARGNPSKSRSWPECIIWEIFVRSVIELWEIEEIPMPQRKKVDPPKSGWFAERIEEIARRTIQKKTRVRKIVKEKMEELTIKRWVKNPKKEDIDERHREIKDAIISEIFGQPSLGGKTGRDELYRKALAWTRHIFGYDENWMRKRMEGGGRTVYDIAKKRIEDFVEKEGSLGKAEQTKKDGLFEDILDKVLFGMGKTNCLFGPRCHYDRRLRDFPTGPHNPLMPAGAYRCRLVKDHHSKGVPASGGVPVLRRRFYWLT